MTDEPRIFQHVLALYTHLNEQAKNGIFTGSKVAAFRAINVSQGYYSQLYGALEEMGCIETLVIGRGGGKPTEVRLHYPPELDKFQEIYAKALTKPNSYDMLRQELKLLQGRLPDIDIPAVLLDFEQRISALEKSLEGKGGTQIAP